MPRAMTATSDAVAAGLNSLSGVARLHPFGMVGARCASIDSPMARTQRDRPSWVRWSGIGFEVVGAVAGLTLVGYWVDRRYGCQPWGVLIGAGLGLVGGMYNLIRESLAAVKENQDGGAGKPGRSQ